MRGRSRCGRFSIKPLRRYRGYREYLYAIDYGRRLSVFPNLSNPTLKPYLVVIYCRAEEKVETAASRKKCPADFHCCGVVVWSGIIDHQ